ncbi:MAG: organomercurial lyase [Streptosporangiaceae bacterium]
MGTRYSGRVRRPYRQRSGGPSAQLCCGHINFFTSHATAAGWASTRPGIAGGILGQARAYDVGRQIFGPLLR